METIKYKFNVGDTVQFKNKFHPTASCGLKTHRSGGRTNYMGVFLFGFIPLYVVRSDKIN